jgi:hypothetical protein
MAWEARFWDGALRERDGSYVLQKAWNLGIPRVGVGGVRTVTMYYKKPSKRTQSEGGIGKTSTVA